MTLPGLLFDECDRALVESQPWSLTRGYVWGNVPGRRGRTHYLARLIVGAKPGEYVDHINHNKLDNRRANLRIVTAAQNAANKSGAQINSKTGIRGVYWDKDRSKWVATARAVGAGRLTRRFDSLHEATRCVRQWRLTNMNGATS